MRIAPFVVSLLRRPDRRRVIGRHLSGRGFPFQWVDAVDGSGMPEEEFGEFNAAVQGRKLNRGEVGCFRSHLRVLERLRAGPPAHGLVLEDDALLAEDTTPDSLEVLARRLDSVVGDWDTFLLHKHYLEEFDEIVRRDGSADLFDLDLPAATNVEGTEFLRVHKSTSATALLYNGRSLDKLRRAHSRIVCSFDLVRHLKGSDLKIVSLTANLATYDRKSPSDVDPDWEI